MAKLLPLLFAFVCSLHAFAQRVPLLKEESEERLERIKSFNQPAPVRYWKVVEEAPTGWKEWESVENFSFGINRGTMPTVTDLESLHPYFRDQVIELIRICKTKGIQIAVVETYRTQAKQKEYRNMGRRYTRTSPGKSKHQYGLAVDLVPMVDSIPKWRNVKLWRKIGPIAERLGMRWGGRWRRLYDPCHFEWSGGISSQSLAQGIFPRLPRPETYPCIDEDLKELRRHWKDWEQQQSVLYTASRKTPTRRTAQPVLYTVARKSPVRPVATASRAGGD